MAKSGGGKFGGSRGHVTSGSGYFVTVTKCPDPVVTRLSINSGKMFVSRNIFIHRIFPICSPQSVPCLYFHREGRAPSGTLSEMFNVLVILLITCFGCKYRNFFPNFQILSTLFHDTLGSGEFVIDKGSWGRFKDHGFY